MSGVPVGFCDIDLVIVDLIRNTIKHLQENPRHVAFLFNCFNNQCHQGVNAKYMKGIMDFINNDDPASMIRVFPHFTLNEEHANSISVIKGGSLNEKFVGQGTIHCKDYSAKDVPPELVVGGIDITSVNPDDPRELIVSNSYDLEARTWPNLYLSRGDASFKVKGVYKGSRETIIELYEPFEGPKCQINPLDGWGFYLAARGFTMSVSNAADDMSIAIKIWTSGAFEQHRYLATIVRYAIISNVLKLQNHRFIFKGLSYTHPIQAGGAKNDEGFQSVVNLSGEYFLSWISGYAEETSESAKITVDYVAESTNPKNDRILADEI